MPDYINLIYTDVPLSFQGHFETIGSYTDEVRRSVFVALEEEAVLVEAGPEATATGMTPEDLAQYAAPNFQSLMLPEIVEVCLSKFRELIGVIGGICGSTFIISGQTRVPGIKIQDMLIELSAADEFAKLAAYLCPPLNAEFARYGQT